LVVIHLVVAVNALAGAAYGLAGAPAIPRSWLGGSPFHDYVVPSLFLAIAVGGTQLVAAAALVRSPARRGAVASLVASGALAAWILAQVAIIGPVSWLQPALLLVAGASAVLAVRVRP
jgi:hypothetical protein